MELPVYELKIVEDMQDDAEVSFVALVDKPAIMKDFHVFGESFIEPSKGEDKEPFLQRCIKYVIDEGKESEQAVAICNSLWEQHFAEGLPHYTKERVLWTGPTHKSPDGRLMTGATHTSESEYLYHLEDFAEDSYTDYPQQAKENAKIALRWAEENGWGECGTPVGKARANQLANGENISEDTISRMASFERHRQNSKKELGDGCGRLMWLAWGGDAGIEWASRKLEQIRKENFVKFEITNEEQHIISGPLMLADTPIYRDNKKFGEHYVTFSPETIKDIAIKFSKKGYQKNVNLMHDSNMQVDGLVMFESFIVDKSRGVLPMAGYEDAKDGSWFGSFYVENEQVWKLIKEGKVKGFSVEGYFDYAAPNKEESYAEKKLKELSALLKVPF